MKEVNSARIVCETCQYNHEYRFELQCVTCKNIFLGCAKNEKNCSDECRNVYYNEYQKTRKEFKKYKINCKLCGIEHKTNQKTTKFCSSQCGVQWTCENNKEIFNKSTRQYEKMCIVCKKIFIGYAGNAKSCSDECRIEHRRNRHKKYRKTRMKTIFCKRCKKEYITYKKYTKFCGRSCGSKWIIENTDKFDSWINSKSDYSISKDEKRLLSLIAKVFTGCDITSHNKANIKINKTLYKPDILIDGQVIVEYYGDYWHMNSVLYHEDDYNKSKEKYAYEIWKYDANRKRDLIANGYNVLIIWENDFKKDEEKIVKKLIEQIEELLPCKGVEIDSRK